MKPNGISAHELSRKIGMPGKHLKQAVNTLKPVSAGMAPALSGCLRRIPGMLLSSQIVLNIP